MKDRIRELRKSLGMNQTEFGDRIGVKQGTVAGYENGLRTPLDTVISSICREFRVSRLWLEQGEGPMLTPQPVADLAQEIRDLMKGEPPLASAVMASLAAMPREWWNAWAEKLYEEVERQKKRDNG